MKNWKNRAKWWLRAKGYPWFECITTGNRRVFVARQAEQDRMDRRLVEEQAKTQSILDGVTKIRLVPEYKYDNLEVHCRVTINRYMLYQMTDNNVVWQHFADRMAHDIERELKTINFATVRRGIEEDWRR